jgi:uncharacterized membrane protein YgcG|tara:strand:+ start:576 stop:1664 length:1089 start_codon:yes stop_codon:yes gene_type:complete
MYLPKHQYQKIKASDLQGTLVDNLGNIINQNKEVIITSAGKIFDTLGIDFDTGDFSKAIFLSVTNDDKVEEEFSNFIDENGNFTPSQTSTNKRISPVKLPPNFKDKEKGFMKRAFHKNTSTGKVKEITLNTVNKIRRVAKPYDKFMVVTWFIKGPAKDQIVNGYFLEGIESKNQKTIERIKKELPGAEKLILGANEYVIDTLPLTRNNVQPPINTFDLPSPSKTSLLSSNTNNNRTSNNTLDDKVQENLYANPGEFLLEGTMKEYVGPYHLHPTKGPMVGAKHVQEPHSRLVPRDKSKNRYSLENRRPSSKVVEITQINTEQRASQQTSTPSTTQTTTAPSSTPSYSGGSSGGGSSSGGGGY